MILGYSEGRKVKSIELAVGVVYVCPLTLFTVLAWRHREDVYGSDMGYRRNKVFPQLKFELLT